MNTHYTAGILFSEVLGTSNLYRPLLDCGHALDVWKSEANRV